MKYEKHSPTEARIINIIPEHTEEEIVALVDLKVKLASLQSDLAQENARHLKEVSGLNEEIAELVTKITEVEAVGVVEEAIEIEKITKNPVEVSIETLPVETPIEKDVPIDAPVEIPIENIKPE